MGPKIGSAQNHSGLEKSVNFYKVNLNKNLLFNLDKE